MCRCAESRAATYEIPKLEWHEDPFEHEDSAASESGDSSGEPHQLTRTASAGSSDVSRRRGSDISHVPRGSAVTTNPGIHRSRSLSTHLRRQSAMFGLSTVTESKVLDDMEGRERLDQILELLALRETELIDDERVATRWSLFFSLLSSPLLISSSLRFLLSSLLSPLLSSSLSSVRAISASCAEANRLKQQRVAQHPVVVLPLSASVGSIVLLSCDATHSAAFVSSATSCDWRTGSDLGPHSACKKALVSCSALERRPMPVLWWKRP